MGSDADLTIFDPERIIDCATCDALDPYSAGIEYVSATARWWNWRSPAAPGAASGAGIAAKTSSRTTSFTGRLSRLSGGGHPKPVRNAIRDLRGIGRDMFTAVGGGERWLREEREAFDAALADKVLRGEDDEP